MPRGKRRDGALEDLLAASMAPLGPMEKDEQRRNSDTCAAAQPGTRVYFTTV
jgi:hypothetical protein